jgi:ribosome-binding factor A
MSTRIDRISEEVRKALAEALRAVKDPRVQNGMVSVTRCEVTGDLRYAKAYISVLGTPEQAKEVMRGLKSASGWLRREVGHKVQLRYAPELLFELDESIVHGAHISALLHDLEKQGKMGSDASEETSSEQTPKEDEP